MSATRTHRVLRRNAAGGVTLGFEALGPPEQDDVLVAPLRVGICGTDLDILRGARRDSALVLGHEGIGQVIASSGRTGVEPGSLVIFNPVNPANPADVLGHSKPGILAQMVRVAASDVANGMIVPAHRGLAVDDGPLVEPLATAVYGHQIVTQRVDPHTVAVVGAGSIGLINALYARARGASRVILVDRSCSKLQWAVSHSIVEPNDAVQVDFLMDGKGSEHLKQHRVDATFVCVSRGGAQSALLLALDITRDGGIVDLVAALPSDPQASRSLTAHFNSIRGSNNCGWPRGAVMTTVRCPDGRTVHLTGHRGTSAQHLRDAMDVVVAQPQTFRRLVTHTVAMSEAAPVLESMVARRGDFGPHGLPYLQGPVVKVVVNIET